MIIKMDLDTKYSFTDWAMSWLTGSYEGIYSYTMLEEAYDNDVFCDPSDEFDEVELADILRFGFTEYSRGIDGVCEDRCDLHDLVRDKDLAERIEDFDEERFYKDVDYETEVLMELDCVAFVDSEGDVLCYE